MEHIRLDHLSAYDAQLPHLTASFQSACLIPPRQRLIWGKGRRKEVFRDGWFVNTPVGLQGDAETVDAHAEHLIELIKEFFPRDVQAQAILYAEYHDDHEVIAHAVVDGMRRDLNPRFNKISYAIGDEDKKIIEATARDVLFEDFPDLKNELNAYPDSDELASRLFRDLDKICVMWRCVEFVESGKYTYADFQCYWDYWPPEKIRTVCHPLLSDAYLSLLQPRIDQLTL